MPEFGDLGFRARRARKQPLRNALFGGARFGITSPGLGNSFLFFKHGSRRSLSSLRIPTAIAVCMFLRLLVY